jgi:hypothetical protein
MLNDSEKEKGSGSRTGDSIRRKVRSPGEYSFSDVVDRLSERDWRVLIDLYFCRCIPQSVVIDTFFLDSPDQYYKGYIEADTEMKKKLEEKNRNRALLKGRRKMWELYLGGLIESSSVVPDELDKPIHTRKRVRGEAWYYLTGRGLRVVEVKKEILEQSRLSKLELDMERARKEHFWELAKVYLDLKYDHMAAIGARQFYEWDWYPALTVHADKNTSLEIRPDAVFRLQEQVFYIELDRSTEPIQRSPFMTDQVSIASKLKRYRDVMSAASTVSFEQRNGIIAFIVPEAIYETRMKNILKVAVEVLKGTRTQVLVGRNIGDIFDQRIQAASKGKKDG